MFLRKLDSIFCFILLLIVAGGNTACLAPDGKYLECIFPENINITKKDFVVYFYPPSGDGEGNNFELSGSGYPSDSKLPPVDPAEKLVDCAWFEEQIHCIKQDGFDCKQPVSRTADISIPTRFAARAGNYKCISDGYKPDDIKSCHFPGRQDNNYSSSCEVISEEKPQVNVTCSFSFSVESFTVKEKSDVVASYTKSGCLRSNNCRYHGGKDFDSVFTVMLEAPSREHYEYSCVPETPTPQLQVKSCKPAIVTQSETPSFMAAAVILPLLLVLAVTFILLLRRKRQRKNPLRYKEEYLEADESHETSTSGQTLINDKKCFGKEMADTVSEVSSLIARESYVDCTADDEVDTNRSSNGIDYTLVLPRNDLKGQCTTQYSSNALILPQTVSKHEQSSATDGFIREMVTQSDNGSCENYNQFETEKTTND